MTALRTKNLALVALVALLGCDRFFTRQPKTSELVGVYRLTQVGETFLAKRKNYKSVPDSTLTLRSDGSMSLTNLPDCATNGFGESTGGFVSAEGTWTVEKDFIEWKVKVEGDLSPYIQVRGRSAPYRLAVIVGDPDSGETLQYEKRSET